MSTPSGSPVAPSPNRPQWLPAGAVLAMVALVFAAALGGSFVYDDLSLIVGNPGLHDPGDLAGLWSRPLWGEQLGHWRPLTAQLLALGWWLGDGRPWAVHAMALLLHLWATAAVLRFWPLLGGSGRGAVVAALLFALHPAQAESVAWCSALNDVLCGACALNGVLCWLRWRDGGRLCHRIAALGLAAAAMAAKEAGVVVPLLYCAADFAGGRGRRGLFAHVGSVALLAIYYLLRALVFGEASAGFGRTTFAHAGSALELGAAVGSGLTSHLLVPTGLGMFAPLDGVGFLDHAMLVGLVGALALACWRGGRSARIAAAFVAAGLLPPMLSVANLGPYPIADRYLYPACAGLALLLATVAERRTRAGAAPMLMLLLLAVGFGAATFGRLATWSDQPTFTARALRRYPDDPRLHYMQGRLLLDRAGAGDAAALEQAQAEFQLARRLLGGDLKRLDSLSALRAETANALAWCVLLQERGRTQPDLLRVERAFLDLVEQWPDRADGWVGLGVVRAASGRLDAAELALRRAIGIDPGAAQAHHNLAQVLLQRGDRRGARAELLEALRLRPDDAGSEGLLQQLDGAAGRPR